MNVDTGSDRQLNKYEEELLGYGAMTMGEIVRQVGFEDSNDLHLKILDWIVASTDSRNPNIAAHSIWGLGLLGARHHRAINCLNRIIQAELRPIEHEVVTFRSIALRMLAMIDASLVFEHQSSQAWIELRRALEWWQRESPVEWLRDELQWLPRAE